MMRLSRLLLTAAALLAAIPLTSERGEAHKPITSPYTYNADVFPILRDRCGRCHVPGGVAPMSLMTYKDAFPWGESIRTELVAGHMPPWSVHDLAGKFSNVQRLSAKELNVLLTWVTGGNPMGPPESSPPPVDAPTGWRLGPPDLVIPLPSAFTLAADVSEATHEVTLPIAATPFVIRAVDILPGNPAMVRSATIGISSDGGKGGGPTTRESLLALWTPGEDPVPLAKGIAFRLPAGAGLVVRVHYKKTWQYERMPMSDRLNVGIYFAAEPAVPLQALPLSASSTDGGTAGRTASEAVSADRIAFSRTVDENLTAMAIYPDRALTDSNVTVSAHRPDGTSTDLIRFRPQADWVRRYWFAQPVALPRGTRLDVVADFREPLLPPGAAPVTVKRPEPSSVRLTLNVVPAR